MIGNFPVLQGSGWSAVLKGFSFLWATHVFWLPVLAFVVFFHIWFHFKRMQFILGLKCVLLELHFPKDVQKSPAAMEVLIMTLIQHNAGSLFEVYFQGAVRLWFSLEIISDGGKVRFFIWTPERCTGP